MNANKGHPQFEMSPKSRWLSVFTTEKEGQWQFKSVPFGLQNAPAFFQCSIDSLLGRWRWQFVLAYIDDIVIWSASWKDHLDHLFFTPVPYRIKAPLSSRMHDVVSIEHLRRYTSHDEKLPPLPLGD